MYRCGRAPNVRRPSLSETELALATSRPGLHAQAHCVLQIGYFKAKHAFFRFDWSMVADDCAFVLSRYFHGEVFAGTDVTHHEHYTQRGLIAALFGYRLWSTTFLPQLTRQAAQIVRRDVTPGFVAADLIVWLNEHKIVHYSRGVEAADLMMTGSRTPLCPGLLPGAPGMSPSCRDRRLGRRVE